MENAALRLQLAAFQRKRKRPVLSSFDRLFWVGLSLIWNGWRAGVEGAREAFCADEAFPVEEFDSKLTELLDGARNL